MSFEEPVVPQLTKEEFEELASFRFLIRRYLRTSEHLVRRVGLTPQQYMLLLSIKGYPGREWATIQEISEKVQLRHHSVVELIDRAQRRSLVRRTGDPDDGRVVRVSLAPRGEELLAQLGAQHIAELRRLRALMMPLASESRMY